MKPYYDDGQVQIYLGDYADLLPRVVLPDAALFCDPPYGVEKAEWDAELKLDWLDLAAPLYPVIAVTPGTVNLGQLPQAVGPLRYRWMLSAYLANGRARGAFGFGNWIACAVYSPPDFKLHSNSQDAKRFTLGSVPMVQDHPSPKPLAVMEWIVGLLPGTGVVDCCMGSGTTLVAARTLGKRAVGFEREERYCEVAARRLSQGLLLAATAPTVPILTAPGPEAQGALSLAL